MITLVNEGIDSLHIRISKPLPPSDWLASQMPLWDKYQESASDFPADYIVPLRGLGTFKLLPFAKRPYKYLLVNDEIADIRIYSSRAWQRSWKGKTGQLYVDFRSKFLQYQGLQGVLNFLLALERLCFPSMQVSDDLSAFQFWRVSRADIFCDVSGFSLDWADMPNFVSRVKKRDGFASSELAIDRAIEALKSQASPPKGNKGDAIYNLSPDTVSDILQSLTEYRSLLEDSAQSITRQIGGERLQTLYFGKFGGALYARIYNKTASLKKQNKEYMRQIWASNGWDEQSEVWRIEYSLSGDFLKKTCDAYLSEYDETGCAIPDLRDFHLFCESIPSLWGYLSRSWLRHCIPQGDTNQSRWRESQFWQVVQSANGSQDSSILRVRPPRNPDDEQLLKQIEGCVKSLSAIRQRHDSDLDSPIRFIHQVVDWFDSDAFWQEVRERRQSLGIDDYSGDTLYSASVRKLRMSWGGGS